jgi:hypothetical protein
MHGAAQCLRKSASDASKYALVLLTAIQPGGGRSGNCKNGQMESLMAFRVHQVSSQLGIRLKA